MKRYIILYILAGCFLLMGIAMIIDSLTPPPELQEASALKRNEFAADAAYHFEGLEIWEKYGSVSGSSDDSGVYYIAFYPDADGQLALFSVYLDSSDDWKAKVRACDFMTDSLSVDACFQSEKISAVHNDLEDFYAEAVDFAVDYLREYGVNPIDSGLHLRFVCDEPADYADTTSEMSPREGGIFMLILCAGLFFLAYRSRKKARKKELEAQLELWRYSGVSASLRNEDGKGPEF